MIKRIVRNKQYREFILDNILCPYQSCLGYEDRITFLTQIDTTKSTAYNYNNIIIEVTQKPEWWALVMKRCTDCFAGIEFSFFPEDEFAIFLKNELIKNGIKSV